MAKQAEIFKNFWFWFLMVLFFSFNIVGGWFFNMYDIWYFDIIMHFSGGLGVYFFAKFYFKETLKNASWFDSAFLLVSSAVFVGVLWELYEFALSNFWITRPEGVELIGDLQDTIKDLFVDTSGAVFASVLHFFRHRKP